MTERQGVEIDYCPLHSPATHKMDIRAKPNTIHLTMAAMNMGSTAENPGSPKSLTDRNRRPI